MTLSLHISVSILKCFQAILAEKSMNLNLMAAEKDCFVDLNLIAIGGGGGSSTERYGGHGSGYVETATFRMSVNSPEGEITVGQLGESSKVEIAGELVLEALPGRKGDGGVGGAGYSGGGGGDEGGVQGGIGGSGGSNGGNSTYGPGGKGSGFDLNLVTLKNFILTPGAGGQPDGGVGGGGGGVAVNGKMPDITSKYAGAGFGGGSDGYYDYHLGYQGCVIVEM